MGSRYSSAEKTEKNENNKKIPGSIPDLKRITKMSDFDVQQTGFLC
jgi:hypothetical protein